MKGASCRPFQSLANIHIICFGSVNVDIVTNWRGELKFKSQVGPK